MIYIYKKKESKYRVKTLIIDADFCSNPEDIYPRIKEKIQGLKIGVLINNVGMSYAHPEYLVEVGEKIYMYIAYIYIFFYTFNIENSCQTLENSPKNSSTATWFPSSG